MGDTSETNTKVLSRELFLGVVALKMTIQKNHYLSDMGSFPRYCHIMKGQRSIIAKKTEYETRLELKVYLYVVKKRIYIVS